MSGYSQVKGITVKINGDTTGLQKALNNVKAQTAGLDKTMSKLKSSMKLNPGDYQSFATYQDLLKDKITNTTKQLDVYNKALAKFPKTQAEWSTAVSNGKTNLANLNSELKNTNTQINAWQSAIENGTRTAQEASAPLATLQAKQTSLTNAIAEQKTELKSLGKTYEESQQTLHGLQAAQETCANQLVGLKNQFISTNSAVLKTVHVLDQASQKANSFANAIKPLSTVSAVALAGSAAAAISFEDAWTGVTKTVNGTPSQLKKVNDGLKELATTTSSSYSTVASYAEIAGQMGVQTENVVEFTKVITELGDTTNLVGEEAAQALAKFANIMQGAGTKSNEYYSRLGSTIVDLGNKFATTESDITEMSERLAVGAKQVGINEQGVLALSTALSSLGIKAEAGGSSVSKVLKTIESQVKNGGEYLEEYAKVAGMTAEEFASAWENDALGTFVKVIQGIGSSADGVTVTLEKLGITSIRQSQSIAALAQSSDVLTSAIATANSAWDENSAMTTEAEKRYATLKSQLSQTWEAIKQAGNELGQSLTPYITKMAKAVKNVALAFSNLDDGTQDTIAKLLTLTAVAYPAAKGFSKITSVASKGIVGLLKYRTGLEGVTSILTKTGVVAEGTTSSIAGLITGFATGHPIIAATTVALGAFAAAVAYATKKHQEEIAAANEALSNKSATYKATLQIIDEYETYSNSMTKINKKISSITSNYDKNVQSASTLMTTIKQLNAQETLNSAEKALMKEAVEQLNELYPELNVQIDSNTGKLNLNEDANYQSIDAIEERISALQEQAKQEALSKIATKNATAELKAQMESAELSSSLANTVKEFQNLNKEYVNGKISAEEWQNQTTAVRESLFSLCSDLSDSYTKLHETQANAILQSNYLETNSMTEMGTSMKNTMTDLMNQAAQAGIQIPINLQEGITNGTANAVEAANYMASLMNLNNLVDEAGMIGGSIPLNVANGILANCDSISSATDAMNALITLAQAVQSAGLEGQEIPQDVAEAVASGEMSVGDAVAQMMKDADPNLQEAAEKMVKSATKTGDNIGTAFSSNTSAASGVSSMGDSMEQALNTSLSSMEKSASKTANNIKNSIAEAQTYANNNPITITKKTVNKGSSDSSKQSLMPNIVSYASTLADTLTDTQPLALPNSVDTAYISSRTIADSSIRSSARVDALSSKLDSFIDAFMSANLTINLQPMELDGGVITDVVQETISIRELLSSWGKGGS